MSTLWTPALIDTALWLDAADASTLTLDAGAVSEWRDKSGNARHATPPTATKPTHTSAGINSLGTVVFASGTDPLLTPAFSNPTGADGLTLVMVVEKTGEPVNFSSPVTKGAVNAEWSLVIANTAQGAKSFWRNNTTSGNTVTSATNFGVNTPRVFSGQISNSSVSQFYTGNAEGSSGAATRNLGASSSLTIGGSPDSAYAANRFQGLISEIVLVHADVSTPTRQKIEGYLAHKWGLAASLPADHPYKDAAPTVISISGIVTNDAGQPAARTVRVYDRATGALLGTATSDPVTGAYEFIFNTTDEVQRIVLDDEGGTLYNDIIDRVIPA